MQSLLIIINIINIITNKLHSGRSHKVGIDRPCLLIKMVRDKEILQDND